ncbi:MAG TPA: beta-L-arabinofuranosidase domain-containing protein [Vicinamibacterales bacterium]|nr:beta-L-arabinofuranosidase domain-containing protein [Vicinamibacterales bacterium]
MNRRDSLKLLAAVAGSALPWPMLARDAQQAGSSSLAAADAASAPVFMWLPLGEIKPAGWIREQMVHDLHEGFAGSLGQLCHEASSDIFVSQRNSLQSQNVANRLGVAWWNGESEGNWRAGFIMLAGLTDDEAAMREADAYVAHILSSQDTDGYLGIFAKEMRFQHAGELWTQACLLRGLLDYAELTGRTDVRRAVERAADLIVSTYGPGRRSLPWGESHDLMIADVMERLTDLIGDAKYRDFTLWMYETWSQHDGKSDTTLPSLLDLDAPFVQHGVHTCESIRVPLWLATATGRADLGLAARQALEKLARYIESSGSVVSQELIDNQRPDPTTTEYEYCVSKETQLTFQSALQKTGVASFGDRVERVWFNAAQGARTPDGRAISYLTPDNRLGCNGRSLDGTRDEPRNKFSPTHADVAVCCNPNATQVAALFVRGMWMRHGADTLAALLYGPCRVSTTVSDVKVEIDERTAYPFDYVVEIGVAPARDVEFSLLLRDPEWSRGTAVDCPNARISREGDYWRVTKRWTAGDTVRVTFAPVVREIPAVNGEVALQYGALVFAKPIASTKSVTKSYPLSGFEDTHYEPAPGEPLDLKLRADARWTSFGFAPVQIAAGPDIQQPFDAPTVALRGQMLRADGTPVDVELVPLGNAPLLRRVTFGMA